MNLSQIFLSKISVPVALMFIVVIYYMGYEFSLLKDSDKNETNNKLSSSFTTRMYSTDYPGRDVYNLLNLWGINNGLIDLIALGRKSILVYPQNIDVRLHQEITNILSEEYKSNLRKYREAEEALELLNIKIQKESMRSYALPSSKQIDLKKEKEEIIKKLEYLSIQGRKIHDARRKEFAESGLSSTITNAPKDSISDVAVISSPVSATPIVVPTTSHSELEDAVVSASSSIPPTLAKNSIGDDASVPEELTTTISFPKSYKLNEHFMVRLSIVKGEKPTITLRKILSTDLAATGKNQSNDVATVYPYLAPSNYIQAILWYDNKEQEAQDPKIQSLSSKYASIWTWEILPESTGIHYIRIAIATRTSDAISNSNQPYFYQIEVTESLISKIKRISSVWITPQWISADWLWKTILLPLILLVLLKIRAIFRFLRKRRKMHVGNSSSQ
ncbi:TPA: hypothetical protein ACTY2L_005058 [Klebsiella michiganensis]